MFLLFGFCWLLHVALEPQPSSRPKLRSSTRIKIHYTGHGRTEQAYQKKYFSGSISQKPTILIIVQSKEIWSALNVWKRILVVWIWKTFHWIRCKTPPNQPGEWILNRIRSRHRSISKSFCHGGLHSFKANENGANKEKMKKTASAFPLECPVF